MPSAPPAPKPLEIKVGDVVLDRYRVLGQIGSGGHSVVFKGHDERLSRPVCIKVFSGLGSESGVGRTSYEHFVQEAFALSRLTHPNTLRIYDFGHLGPKDAAGMPLQVCEYMNGGTLSNVLREEGPQSLAETVRITSAMCAALAEAHGVGIVHRDIKPQNILFGSVGPSRLPKLADFGIAKWTVDDSSAKENIAEDTAMVAGQKLAMYSPSWAAPEQLAGHPVSPTTDIYSLACVAIFMLSGKAIFADEDVYAGYKKRRQAEEHVRAALQPLELPRGVIDVMVRALAFDPKRRVTKVEELSAEMQSTLPPASVRPQEATPGDEPAPALMTEPESALTPAIVRRPAESTGTTSPLSRARVAEAPPTSSPGAPTLPASAPDLTPPTYHAHAAQAWMAHAPVPAGVPSRLPLSDVTQQVGDQYVHFVRVIENADLVGPHGTKVRVTLLPGPTGGRVVHLKGLSCFVAPLGGRPSPAVQLDRSSDVALVTPRAQEIGHLRVAQGTPGPGHVVFQIASVLIAVGTEDCADPILFDFGPGADAYFVYTRGRTVPKSGRRG
jgi:serine/threonine-protein kinase